jgi:hypothetical protein
MMFGTHARIKDGRRVGFVKSENGVVTYVELDSIGKKRYRKISQAGFDRTFKETTP